MFKKTLVSLAALAVVRRLRCWQHLDHRSRRRWCLVLGQRRIGVGCLAATDRHDQQRAGVQPDRLPGNDRSQRRERRHHDHHPIERRQPVGRRRHGRRSGCGHLDGNGIEQHRRWLRAVHPGHQRHRPSSQPLVQRHAVGSQRSGSRRRFEHRWLPSQHASHLQLPDASRVEWWYGPSWRRDDPAVLRQLQHRQRCRWRIEHRLGFRWRHRHDPVIRSRSPEGHVLERPVAFFPTPHTLDNQ